MSRFLILVFLSLGILGCGHGRLITNRFAADFNCRDRITVKRIAGTSYLAQGCGDSATYTCASNANVCVREEQAVHRPVRVSNRALRATQQQGNVERGYDEQRKLHTVRATFKTAPNVTVVLAGAPGATLGEVLVGLSVPHYLSKTNCESIQVLVNKVPATGERPTKSYKNAIVTVQGRVQFETFKPLAQQFSTLGVRACGYEAELSDELMNDAKKFFVIYSQLATDALQQAQPPVQTQPASDGTATEL